MNRITLAALWVLLIPQVLPAQTNEPTPATDDYSSVPPLSVAQKINYRVIQTFGPRGLLDAGLGAAVDSRIVTFQAKRRWRQDETCPFGNRNYTPDSGTQRIAIAKIASAFGTGQLVNVWQPPSTGSVGDGLTRTGLIFAEHAAWNVAQDFIPRLRAKSLRQ